MKKLIPSILTGTLILATAMAPSLNLKVSAEAGQALFINEIMAANTITIRDGDVDDAKSGALGGAYSDWIEIYNSSSQPVNLAGYTISDDGASWTISQGTVPSNGYLLIWASDKSKVAADGQIHTNFKLTSAGETITLKKADGTIVDSVKFPALADDQSYSRITDGASEFTTASTPTPRSRNISSTPNTGNKISGYVKPSFLTLNKSLFGDFKVILSENGKSAITDSNGYFEISDVSGSSAGYTVKISKAGYLTRTISSVVVQGNVSIGSAAAPVEIWAGDITQDNAINMSDVVKIANSFNAITNDANYNAAADINMNGSINMEDVIILAKGFGNTSSDYPAVTPSAAPSSTASPTPVTPTPTPVDPDAWKLNTGTINLGSSITYTGAGISVNGSVVNITSGGDHTVKGTLTDGMIYINTTEKVKLRLSGASITNSTGPAIYCNDADKFYITIEEGTTNTLIDGKIYSDPNANAALFSSDDLEIKGKGTLNITGNYGHAISGKDDVLLENGVINVISAVSDGIHVNGAIEITGGTFNITASKDGIQNEDEELVINGGKLTLSAGGQGLVSDTGVVVNGGTLTVTKSDEGIEAPLITINNGSVLLNAKKGNPLSTSSSITINGGTVVGYGPESQPAAFLDPYITFAINGGTVLIAGSNVNVSQLPTDASYQQSIAVTLSSAQTAAAALCIKDSTGKALITGKPKYAYNSVVFSSPELLTGTTYSIYAGGTVTGGTEANGLITGGTYSGGTIVSTVTF
ncbi:MAG TPA: carbohydrate-binding domain-containing protein [Pseudobacteroides sp.]|uniref:carbohydrate-binding domain-containing protein n=1 Tax=Pseudobacteroides sp. TaxID=1968840 RepID=UPI002F937273